MNLRQDANAAGVRIKLMICSLAHGYPTLDRIELSV